MSVQSLHYSPWRLIKVAAACGICMAAFFWIGAHPTAVNSRLVNLLLALFGTTGFFLCGAFCAFMMLVTLFNMTNLLAVRIEPGGLLTRTLFANRQVAWRDLADMRIEQWVTQGRHYAVLRIVRTEQRGKIDINLKLLRDDAVEIDAFIDAMAKAQRDALMPAPARDPFAEAEQRAMPVRGGGFGRKVVSR